MAISKQKINKSSRPDGISAEYYKQYESILAQKLKDLIANILDGGPIPESWKYSVTTLILKEGRDHMEIQNYRPISLLNVDYKIFATILAERMKEVLPDIIHKDQKGFLPKRYMKNNINILEYYEKQSEKSIALIFLDAEKAFDNISWKFLKTQMEYMEFGQRPVHPIDQIYSSQYTKIIISGKLSHSIQIQKGTRQGYCDRLEMIPELKA